MKRTISLFTLTAVALMLAGFAFAQEGTTPPPSPPKAKAEGRAHHMKKAETRMVCDLNAATKEDLSKLPGLDEATVDKIIAARPFTSRHELVSKSILTSEQYGKIRSMVKVKGAKAEKGMKGMKMQKVEKTEAGK